VHDRWFGVDPRECVSYPYAAASALRNGYLRRPAGPQSAHSVVARRYTAREDSNIHA
jgi:hypothetical protein